MSTSAAGSWQHHLSATSMPMLHVRTGQRFTVVTCNGFGAPIASMKQCAAMMETKRKSLHPVTGPIHVRGVSRGMSVAVHIVGIKLIHDAYQCISYSTGIFPAYGGMRNFHAYKNGQDISLAGCTIPIRPSIGCIATAPRRRMSCGRAGLHGGNLDIPDICAGSVVHLPVYADGALVSVGDVHAVLGWGEISGTGAEVDASVTAYISRSPYRVEYPVIETKKDFFIVGHGKNLPDACRLATGHALHFLKQIVKANANDLYLLLGLCGNLCLGNSTGKTKIASVRITKSLWPKKGSS